MCLCCCQQQSLNGLAYCPLSSWHAIPIYSWAAHKEEEWGISKAAPPLLHMASHALMEVIQSLVIWGL